MNGDAYQYELFFRLPRVLWCYYRRGEESKAYFAGNSHSLATLSRSVGKGTWRGHISLERALTLGKGTYAWKRHSCSLSLLLPLRYADELTKTPHTHHTHSREGNRKFLSRHHTDGARKEHRQIEAKNRDQDTNSTPVLKKAGGFQS